MPTTSSRPSPVCKHCQKPGFADSTGKMQHERRVDPAVYGGRRAEPQKPGKQKQDDPPDRTHPLDKRLFGGTGRAE